jgi:hypothetical protein
MARGDASSRGTASVPAALLKEFLHASHTRRRISLARSVVPLEVRMPPSNSLVTEPDPRATCDRHCCGGVWQSETD